MTNYNEEHVQSVEVTDEMRSTAKESLDEYLGDSDRDRSEERIEDDQYFGAVAELAFSKAVDEVFPEIACRWTPDGLRPEYWKQDFLFGDEEVRVDVKARDLRRYDNPDLIVRVKDDDGVLHSQVFVQVDVEFNDDDVPVRAHVVGFAPDFGVSVGEHFCQPGGFPNGVYHPAKNPRGTQNFKLLVSREQLSPLSSLDSLAGYVENERLDKRDGEYLSVSDHRRWDEFHDVLESNRLESAGMSESGSADA